MIHEQTPIARKRGQLAVSEVPLQYRRRITFDVDSIDLLMDDNNV